jgi:hypothetical protein
VDRADRQLALSGDTLLGSRSSGMDEPGVANATGGDPGGRPADPRTGQSAGRDSQAGRGIVRMSGSEGQADQGVGATDRVQLVERSDIALKGKAQRVALYAPMSQG